MADKTKKNLHPAHTVSNIKSFIPITLAVEQGMYSTWSELFKVHARAFHVLCHIIPPKTTESSSTPSALTPIEKQEWEDVDAVGTISIDLVHMIIAPDQSAMAAWNRLREIFQDNKLSRAVYLEDQLSSLDLASFPNVSDYCTRLKSLVDQLANVGSSISDSRMVLQLVKGLTPAYENVGTMITQTEPLPTFYQARSLLVLEETRRQHHASK